MRRCCASEQWRARVAALLAACVACIVAHGSAARTEEVAVASEYDGKAAFLVSFSKFVEWRKSISAEPTAPIVLGILGEDPFGARLDAVAADQRVDARPIVIRRLAARRDIEDCHIVFVGSSDSRERAAVLPWVAAHGILTVGDAPGFLDAGGMVEFFVEDYKVRFAINLDVAGAAGLKVSSRLAQLATSPRAVRDVRQ